MPLNNVFSLFSKKSLIGVSQIALSCTLSLVTTSNCSFETAAGQTSVLKLFRNFSKKYF